MAKAIPSARPRYWERQNRVTVPGGRGDPVTKHTKSSLTDSSFFSYVGYFPLTPCGQASPHKLQRAPCFWSTLTFPVLLPLWFPQPFSPLPFFQCYRTDPRWGGVRYIITKRTPLYLQGSPPCHQVCFAHHQRKDVSQCQRLVKRERNYLFKSYTDLE